MRPPLVSNRVRSQVSLIGWAMSDNVTALRTITRCRWLASWRKPKYEPPLERAGAGGDWGDLRL